MAPLAPLGGLQQQQQQQQPSNATPPPQHTARPTGAGDAVGGSPPRVGGARGPDDDLYESDLYRIHCFKILPCGKRYAHDWMRCPFRHPGEKAARRPLTEGSWYSATMCPDQMQGASCPRGDACGFAHNVFEHWLHPERYRTQLCRDGAACSRRVCFFAHSIQQLRTPSGRVIPAAESAEAAAAAAAARWAVPDMAGASSGFGGGTAGVMADGPLMEFSAPLPMVDGNSGPLADMIICVPGGSGSDTNGATPSGLPGPAVATVLPSSASNLDPRFNAGATLISSPGHSGLLHATPGLLGSAGLRGPSATDMYQILMQDASHKRSEADAAAEAATRAQVVADNAAAYINQLVLTSPQVLTTPQVLTSPQAVQLPAPLGRRAMSANGVVLQFGDSSPPPRAAPLILTDNSRASLEYARPSVTSGPLVSFLSGDQPMIGPATSGAATLYAAALPGVTPAMSVAPGGQQEVLLQLPLQGAGPQGSQVVWYGTL